METAEHQRRAHLEKSTDPYHGGSAPFGYRIVDTIIGKRLEEDTEQQYAMGVMQELFDAGKSFAEIRRTIKEEHGYDVGEMAIRYIVTGIKRNGVRE